MPIYTTIPHIVPTTCPSYLPKVDQLLIGFFFFLIKVCLFQSLDIKIYLISLTIVSTFVGKFSFGMLDRQMIGTPLRNCLVMIQ
jgi:hypothetical protein